MPRIYTVSFENQAITNANGDYDLLEITPADDKPCELFGIQLFVLTELQEAQEEWLRLSVRRGNTTSGNGSATTPRPVSGIDTAAGFSAETIASTPASAGTPITLMNFAMQVRAGYEIFLPEGCGFWASQADTLMNVGLLAAVADDLNMSGTFWVREYP